MLGKTSMQIKPLYTSSLLKGNAFSIRVFILLLISISIWSCQSDNSDKTLTKSSRSAEKSGFEETKNLIHLLSMNQDFIVLVMPKKLEKLR